MAAAKEKPPASPLARSREPEAAPTAPPNTWERLIADWQRRPRMYLTLLGISGVVLIVAIVGFRYFRQRTQEEQSLLAADLAKALDAEPAERATRLGDLIAQVAGAPQEAHFLWLQAESHKEAGDAADRPEDKIRHYEAALESASKLRAAFPKSPWTTLPWRPSASPGLSPQPSLEQKLTSYCGAQIDWLREHPASLEIPPDADARGTIVLTDPEGQEHALEIRFFSSEAPQAVESFFHLAKEGAFAGMHVYGLEKDDPNTEETHALLLGSAMSKVAPDRPELWGTPEDWAGYTLPPETGRLEELRGRLALERRLENGRPVGVNPTALVLYLDKPLSPKGRSVFAELSGDTGLLDAFPGLAGTQPLGDTPANSSDQDRSRRLRLEKPWTISRVSVEGQPEHPPARPLKMALQLPAPPPPPEEEPKDSPGPPSPPGEEPPPSNDRK